MFELLWSVPVLLIGYTLYVGNYAVAILIGAGSFLYYQFSQPLASNAPLVSPRTPHRPRRATQLRNRSPRPPNARFQFSEIPPNFNDEPPVKIPEQAPQPESPVRPPSSPAIAGEHKHIEIDSQTIQILEDFYHLPDDDSAAVNVSV